MGSQNLNGKFSKNCKFCVTEILQHPKKYFLHTLKINNRKKFNRIFLILTLFAIQKVAQNALYFRVITRLASCKLERNKFYI
jgi:hypothetical protein